jgi:hypothetical protein
MSRRKKSFTNRTTSTEVSSNDTSVENENLALGDETDTQPASPVIDELDVTEPANNEPIVDALDETAVAINEPVVSVAEGLVDAVEELALTGEMETQPSSPVDETNLSIASETPLTIDNVVTEIPLDNPIINPINSVETVDALLSPDDINGMTSDILLSPDEIDTMINAANSTTQSFGANSMNMNNPTNGKTSSSTEYEEYKLMPDAIWPPPIFVKRSITPSERFYIENRWHSQWRFFDKKANDSKKLYLRLQRIVVIGSVTVPVLVSLDPDIIAGLINWLPLVALATDDSRLLIDFATVVLSLAVAISAGLESLNKYGDNWGSYRQAAEELQAEKSFYDVGGGRYANNPDAFARFVERSEEIIAQQNGRFVATVERQIQESDKRSEEALAKDKNKDRDGVEVTPGQPIMEETSFG